MKGENISLWNPALNTCENAISRHKRHCTTLSQPYYKTKNDTQSAGGLLQAPMPGSPGSSKFWKPED